MSKINPVNKFLCLDQVCETNFNKLFQLIPDLISYENNAVGYAGNKPALKLSIIERTPYTLTVELSHCFDSSLNSLFEPAVKIRVYLDAKLVEVMRDHERSHVSRAIRDPGKFDEIMDYKWTLNYFLEKWLNHCLQTDYQFTNKIPEEAGV
jgi:uncharacterized protein YqiB (DUF1249 family)